MQLLFFYKPAFSNWMHAQSPPFFLGHLAGEYPRGIQAGRRGGCCFSSTGVEGEQVVVYMTFYFRCGEYNQQVNFF